MCQEPCEVQVSHILGHFVAMRITESPPSPCCIVDEKGVSEEKIYAYSICCMDGRCSISGVFYAKNSNIRCLLRGCPIANFRTWNDKGVNEYHVSCKPESYLVFFEMRDIWFLPDDWCKLLPWRSQTDALSDFLTIKWPSIEGMT